MMRSGGRNLARVIVLALGGCAAATSHPQEAVSGERDDPLEDPEDHESAASPGALEPAASSSPLPAEPGPSDPVPSEPLSEAELAAQLAAVVETMSTIAPHARARDKAGRLPDDGALKQAWDEGRARAFRGRFEQVRRWLALAKFGEERPLTNSVGPLAAFDLVVTVRDDEATLHVVVQPHGPKKAGLGQHWAIRPDGERWVALADHMEAGEDYLPFKIDGGASLARQWGKSEVVQDLVVVAQDYRKLTGHLLGVGDISEPTGGKITGHWTHKRGVDADVYLLAPPSGPHGPRVHYHSRKRGKSVWSDLPDAKGTREVPDPETGDTEGAAKLRALAQIVLDLDDIAYFVHDDTRVLEAFDQQAQARRKGRRFLHAKNKAYWPRHQDHVHLRWAWGELSEDAPRP